MRIIGGQLKGRNILLPPSFSGRPTTDFAKEALFNMLENTLDFEELTVLDLFGGSGSISLEFLSRGCPATTCVEMNKSHVAGIRANAKALGLGERLQAVHHNVFDFLKICTRRYKIIFADPPYDLKGLDSLPDKIFAAEILDNQGMLIVEHPAQYNFSAHPRFGKEKKYGMVHFTFFW